VLRVVLPRVVHSLLLVGADGDLRRERVLTYWYCRGPPSAYALALRQGGHRTFIRMLVMQGSFPPLMLLL
jgi:hypothetical protein